MPAPVLPGWQMGIKPLSGVRVLDLTNVLAGPYCCYQLALLGAEVIKVERPGTGDLARQLGADPERNKSLMGVSFLAQNAQKKSVTLDMKHETGKALLKRLVRTSDVLVENFRPGVMERLGVGYDVLKAENPSLIYCAISGFGQDGPWKDNPAYDQIVQGISGVMSITGDGDSAPLRVGYPLADTVGGMTAAFAISAALNDPERGAFLDISMTEAVISTMGWVVSNHLIAGQTPARMAMRTPPPHPRAPLPARMGRSMWPQTGMSNGNPWRAISDATIFWRIRIMPPERIANATAICCGQSWKASFGPVLLRSGWRN